MHLRCTSDASPMHLPRQVEGCLEALAQHAKQQQQGQQKQQTAAAAAARETAVGLLRLQACLR